MYLSEVAIYTDFKLDESYTPTKISIRVGNTFRDLREVSASSEEAVPTWEISRRCQIVCTTSTAGAQYRPR